MIKSMTGFGRCEMTEGQWKMAVEIKAVNHRYMDVSVKIPKKLSIFESSIRSVLKEYIGRGKVDVFVSCEDLSQTGSALKYNEQLAGAYLGYLRKMADDFGLEYDVRVSTLSRYPEVFTMEEEDTDEKELWSVLEKTVRCACERFVQSRLVEGERLKDDLLAKLEKMNEYVDYIGERSPQIVAEYRGRLQAKIQDLLGDAQIDESRIAIEVTLFADKICVDEEMVRLRSHIAGMKDVLISGGGVGRKLDFIAQEMNREANTILSKSSDLSVSDMGINLKTEIEKVREQIQNIE
ncbi:YicC/YloC family endoribonuclease [Lachnospiraceae bacterium 47-T17]